MRNHYKFWTVLSLFIVFIAGIASGVLLEKNILNKEHRSRSERSDSQKRPSVRYPTLDLMADELKLTPEQREQLQEIFKNNEERFKTLRKEQNQSLRTIRSQLIKEINSVLTEEQQIIYEAMIEKYRSQRNREWESKKRQSDRSPGEKGEQK